MKLSCLSAALMVVASQLMGATVEEDFASDPGGRGWCEFGDVDLFQWNADIGALDVTWNSARPNSYYYHKLGTILTKTDDVQLSFDLQLHEIAVGLNPGRPFTFEVSVGLFNLSQATSPNFVRSTGAQSPNLLEFDYFADSGFGATISPLIVSSNGQFVPSFTAPLELTVGDKFHVEMWYRAADQLLATTMHRNGEPVGPVKNVQLLPSFTDFRVDTVAISSYSEVGGDGSLLARGTLDNVVIVVPDPPFVALQGCKTRDGWEVTLAGRESWVYTLERTDDCVHWAAVTAPVAGTSENFVLRDNSAQESALYRVRMERP